MNEASGERIKSRADRILRRLEQLFKETRSTAEQAKQLIDIRLRPVGITGDRFLNFDNTEIHAAAAWVSLRLDPSNKNDSTILKAFDAAGLDAKNPFDWKALVYAFSDAHFGDPNAGKKTYWDDFQYLRLLCNFYVLKSRYPGLKAVEIRRRLRRQDEYKGLSDKTLAKRVAQARDPRKNRYLAHLIREGTIGDPLEAVVRDFVSQGRADCSDVDAWVKETAEAIREVFFGPDKEQ